MNRKFSGLYKKELKIFFSLPVAYAVIAVFMILAGYFFFNITEYYASMSMKAMQYKNQVDLNMTERIFRPFFHNLLIVLILMVPVITMRMFAEEKREGTAELLFTYPVGDSTLVLAKFAASVTVFIAMLAGPLSCIGILRAVAEYSMAPVLGGLLGFFLLGCAFIMVGIFISTLTESQIVAAVISFVVLLMLLLIQWAVPSAGPFWGSVLSNISVVEHFDNFAKGVIDTTAVVYFINIIILFFFLSLRILETKQWRG